MPPVREGQQFEEVTLEAPHNLNKVAMPQSPWSDGLGPQLSSLTCHASRARLAQVEKCVMVASSIKVAPIPLPSLSRFLDLPVQRQPSTCGRTFRPRVSWVSRVWSPLTVVVLRPSGDSPPPSVYRRLPTPSSSVPHAQTPPSTPWRCRANCVASKRRYVPDAADVGVVKKICQSEVELRDHNTVCVLSKTM
jgi:hypothetical protein